MKAYITKYALTKGIQEVDAVQSASEPTMITRYIDNWPEYYHREEWHRTKDAAVCRAAVMRNNKIASLRKKIEKLEKLRFV